MFLKSILSGVFIALAAIINLRCSDPVIGSLFFGFGLFTICLYQFNLFTGIIGYYPTVEKNIVCKINFLYECMIIWLYNFVGTWIVSILYRNTLAYNSICSKVNTLIENKLLDSWDSLLLLGVFCGMLMYLAVSTYKSDISPVLSILILFLCVSIFILSGFEHSIADMAYLCLADKASLLNIWRILIPVTIGNAIGGIGLSYAIRNSMKKE